MASEKVKFTVGLFVASGIAIGIAAIVILGLTGFLEKGQYYMTYFNESVQGLDVDSPVKYRGVSVGRVEGIDVAPDSKLIEVVMKVESGQQALESDMVAQLKLVGITGIMFVEWDRKKEDEPDRSPPLSFPTKYPVVASKPSDIKELLRGIDDVLGQMKSMDLEGISDRIKLAVDNINQSVIDANVKGISSDIGSSLASLERILKTERWDNILNSMEEASQSLGALMSEQDTEIKTAIENFSRAMESANRLMADGSALVSGTEETQARLQRQMIVIGQNLEQASASLKELMDLLADQPSQLIIGKPPAPRRVD